MNENPTLISSPLFVSVKEASIILGYTQKQIYIMCQEGRLGYDRIGTRGNYKILRSSCYEYANRVKNSIASGKEESCIVEKTESITRILKPVTDAQLENLLEQKTRGKQRKEKGNFNSNMIGQV